MFNLQSANGFSLYLLSVILIVHPAQQGLNTVNKMLERVQYILINKYSCLKNIADILFFCQLTMSIIKRYNKYLVLFANKKESSLKKSDIQGLPKINEISYEDFYTEFFCIISARKHICFNKNLIRSCCLVYLFVFWHRSILSFSFSKFPFNPPFLLF